MILALALSTLMLLTPLIACWLALGAGEVRIAQAHYAAHRARACAESSPEAYRWKTDNGVPLVSETGVVLFADCITDVAVTANLDGSYLIDATGRSSGARARVIVTLAKDLATGRYVTSGYKEAGQ